MSGFCITTVALATTNFLCCHLTTAMQQSIYCKEYYGCTLRASVHCRGTVSYRRHTCVPSTGYVHICVVGIWARDTDLLCKATSPLNKQMLTAGIPRGKLVTARRNTRAKEVRISPFYRAVFRQARGVQGNGYFISSDSH